MLAYHREKRSALTIVLKRTKKTTDYGIVITDSDGRIEKFLEKPSWSEVFTDTVNTGMYIIEPSHITRHIPEDEKFDFSLDLFPFYGKRKCRCTGSSLMTTGATWGTWPCTVMSTRTSSTAR
jgi:mannose-1-phosphate guanylyltransferase/phosphomannomutase